MGLGSRSRDPFKRIGFHQGFIQVQFQYSKVRYLAWGGGASTCGTRFEGVYGCEELGPLETNVSIANGFVLDDLLPLPFLNALGYSLNPEP